MDKITRTFDRTKVVYKVYDVESDSIETVDCYVYTGNGLKAKKAIEKRCEQENKKLLAMEVTALEKVIVSMPIENFIKCGDIQVK